MLLCLRHRIGAAKILLAEGIIGVISILTPEIRGWRKAALSVVHAVLLLVLLVIAVGLLGLKAITLAKIVLLGLLWRVLLKWLFPVSLGTWCACGLLVGSRLLRMWALS